MVKLGVLVSGSGSNLQAIIDNIEGGRLDARIQIIVSNLSGVYALERARKHGIPSLVLPHKGLKREEFDKKLVEVLKAHDVELVVLAGFMRVLTPFFLRAFPMRVMNIHPALLPSFPGTHGQKKAFDYGVKFSGCTVHFADEGVDTGPIIIQAVVPPQIIFSVFLFFILIPWIYFAYFYSSRNQGTLGNMAVGVAVTDMQGNRITFGRATLRFFAMYLCLLTLLVGFLIIAFTGYKQGLHDKIAGTLVFRQ